jgi:hypothetical protein
VENAAAIAKLEGAAAAKDARLEEMKAQKAALEAQVAVLQAHMTSKLTDIHTVVAALHVLLPPPPPRLLLTSMAFDREWCAAVCGTAWKVDIDSMRAHVTQKGDGCLTLRSASSRRRRPKPSPLGLFLHLSIRAWSCTRP